MLCGDTGVPRELLDAFVRVLGVDADLARVAINATLALLLACSSGTMHPLITVSNRGRCSLKRIYMHGSTVYKLASEIGLMSLARFGIRVKSIGNIRVSIDGDNTEVIIDDVELDTSQALLDALNKVINKTAKIEHIAVNESGKFRISLALTGIPVEKIVETLIDARLYEKGGSDYRVTLEAICEDEDRFYLIEYDIKGGPILGEATVVTRECANRVCSEILGELELGGYIFFNTSPVSCHIKGGIFKPHDEIEKGSVDINYAGSSIEVSYELHSRRDGLVKGRLSFIAPLFNIPPL